jgi:hypothetical protein
MEIDNQFVAWGHGDRWSVLLSAQMGLQSALVAEFNNKAAAEALAAELNRVTDSIVAAYNGKRPTVKK